MKKNLEEVKNLLHFLYCSLCPPMSMTHFSRFQSVFLEIVIKGM